MAVNNMCMVGLLASLKMRLHSILLDSFLSLDVKCDNDPSTSMHTEIWLWYSGLKMEYWHQVPLSDVDMKSHIEISSQDNIYIFPYLLSWFCLPLKKFLLMWEMHVHLRLESGLFCQLLINHKQIIYSFIVIIYLFVVSLFQFSQWIVRGDHTVFPTRLASFHYLASLAMISLYIVAYRNIII